MNDLQKMTQEKSVLRWGGLAGMLGSLIFILVFVIVFTLVLPLPADREEVVRNFSDIKAARTAENSLYLVVLILWIAPFLALYRVLRETSLAFALFGSVLGILGIVVLAAGALPHVATIPISDLYHAPGTTSSDKETLALIWQATWGIFTALLIVGLVLLPIALVALGVAMLRSPVFGKSVGWVTTVLGLIGIVTAVILLIDPGSPVAVVGVFALIIFHFIIGWKIYDLSRLQSQSQPALKLKTT